VSQYNNGLPRYWRNDQTGQLMRSVDYYSRICSDGNNRSIDDQYHQERLSELRAYFEYWMLAPCFDNDPVMAEINKQLRFQIQAVKTFEELRSWQMSALKQGIDPL
jgi:hypothetical protein